MHHCVNREAEDVSEKGDVKVICRLSQEKCHEFNSNVQTTLAYRQEQRFEATNTQTLNYSD